MSVGVATLGVSPAVVSEFVMALREREKDLTELLLLTTKGSAISFHALKIAFYWSKNPPSGLQNLRIENMSGIRLKEQRIEKDDITSLDDCKEFRHNVHKCLKTALKWSRNNPQEIYVCVAGGRKTMPIDCYLVALANGINNIYHIVAPDLPGVSQLARLKPDEREKIAKELERTAENPEKAPEKSVRETIEWCFPPKDLKFELIKLPYIKLPENIIKEIVG